jgi:hypothetical protein
MVHKIKEEKMRKRLLIVLFTLLSVGGFSRTSNSAIYNGHFYEIVPFSGQSWQEATSHMQNLLGPQ